MNELIIVGALTDIQGSGKIKIGTQDPKELKIVHIKVLITKHIPELHPSQITLWWKGYILDDDSSMLESACIGVNGECLDKNSTKALTLFMTTRPRDLANYGRSHRSNSFDVEKLRLELRKQTKRLPCTIL